MDFEWRKDWRWRLIFDGGSIGYGAMGCELFGISALVFGALSNIVLGYYLGYEMRNVNTNDINIVSSLIPRGKLDCSVICWSTIHGRVKSYV